MQYDPRSRRLWDDMEREVWGDGPPPSPTDEDGNPVEEEES